MDFALARLKKQGVISENVSAFCSCYQQRRAADYEDEINKCDAVIVALEMYRAENIDRNNTRGWQAEFCDDMTELAHRIGKKVIYLSANIPYDIARFTAADAMIAVYNADGMEKLPVDGQENEAYGVNYPAGLITIFGGNVPTGKLPVDVYAVDEDSHYTDDVMFPCGYGMTYEPTIRAAGSNRYGTAAEIAKKAIPNCSLCLYADEDGDYSMEKGAEIMKTFNETMFKVTPKAVGGKLPEDDLYYKPEK